jgi:hypothetical protein
VKLGISAPGMPDLMCLRNGVTEFIEVKALGQVRSPLQRKVARDLESQGFAVLCLTQDGMAVEEDPINVDDYGF